MQTMNDQELRSRIETLGERLIGLEQPLRNRYYLKCEAEQVYEVCRFLFEQVPARFVIATAIDNDDCYEIIYHFAYDPLGTVINVQAYLRDRDHPSVASITPLIAGAEWIEREMHDLMGIDFEGHPRLERLILADDWPEGVYPLRKEGAKGGTS